MTDATTSVENQATTDASTENQAESQAEVKLTSLTANEEISVLRNVHTFLSNFDRVPGSLANQWAQTLDAIAIVANSLISKNVGQQASNSGDAGTTATSAESTASESSCCSGGACSQSDSSTTVQ